MQKHNLTPTLLVGVGGTGVAVLRKFKRLYMEVNDEADQYIKLLAIDTDNQLQGTDPYLDNSEFLQLAKPDPIQVTDVLREARRGTKALEWLATMNLPAFEMHRGAGMKRLQGHLAYFWKGGKIRKQIEETMKPLLEANPSLKHQERASGVRLFIISSLCGGTGTGMFLDIAYMVRDVIEGGGGPRVKTFGLLFLPSAFQQLRPKPAWSAIHANGYAALQELNYYMDTPFRNNKLYVPSGTRPQIELDAAPFQYCFLVGGVNDRGDHVRHSEDLYERTADFLFMNVTTPIGDTLVAHEVENRSLERHNGSKAFAAFGSFSMALPQARNIQKYLLMMGRELLDDVLEEEPKQLSSRGAKELFESIGEFIEASNLAQGSTDLPFASKFVDDVLKRHPKQVTSLDHADAVMATELHEVEAATQEFDQQLVARAQNLRQALVGQLTNELQANWTLAPGTLFTAKALVNGVLISLQNLFDGLERPKSIQCDTFETILDRHRNKGFMGLSLGKPSPRSIPDFEHELVQTFAKRSAARLSEEYQKALASVRDDLTCLQRTFEELRKKTQDYKAQYKTEALKLLNQVAKEESRAFLTDPHIEEETSDYSNERLALWNHCQAQPQLRVLLRSPRDGSLDTTGFTRELFKVIRAYVTDRSANAVFTDVERLNAGLQDAKINLKLRPMYHSPETSSMLFADGNEKMAEQLCDAIQNAPGDFGRPPQPYPSLDQGSMTFVRVMSSFALDNIADIEFMADCYQQRKRLATEGMYLDLPTHSRADILPLGGEDEGPRLFALSRALGRIEEVGQNFLFDDEVLLPGNEPNAVERRERAYAALLRSDLKTRIEQILDKRIRSLGGNEQFVPDMERKLNDTYPTSKLEGGDPICEILRAELRAAEAYLKTLGVVRTAEAARNDQ